MDKLKSYVTKKLQSTIKLIVTFADNRATKFFSKNLFTKVAKNQTSVFKQSIETYYYASLMEFKVKRTNSQECSAPIEKRSQSMSLFDSPNDEVNNGIGGYSSEEDINERMAADT